MQLSEAAATHALKKKKKKKRKCFTPHNVVASFSALDLSPFQLREVSFRVPLLFFLANIGKNIREQVDLRIQGSGSNTSNTNEFLS